MANPRTLENIEKITDPANKMKGIEEFWKYANQHGTPIIIPNPASDSYQAIFAYQSNQPGRNIFLQSSDLYDRLSKDGASSQLKMIPGTDIYYLKIDNLPANTCAPYNLVETTEEIIDGEKKNKATIIPDTHNHHRANIQRLGLNQQSNIASIETHQMTCMLTPNGSIPTILKNVNTSPAISLTHEKFHSKDYSDKFSDRDIFIYYKPDDFNSETGKVVFMFDGNKF